jgi:hypothetical protein
MRGVVLAGLGVAAGAAAAAAYGTAAWAAGTRSLRARLEAARERGGAGVVDLRRADDVPPPVRRYLRRVLRDGQPMVAAARIGHRGTFNMSAGGDRWVPFRSDQLVICRRPGFDWDARIALAPGVSVRVHDAYVAGEGILHAALLGLLPLARQRGGGDFAADELMRFLAEAPWYPTSLLPGDRVTWRAEGERAATVALADADRVVELRYTFGADDLVEAVYASERGRTVGGRTIRTPWQGRFWNYAERGGMMVPLDGEVAWLLPEGARPYWRGRIVDIAHDLAT